MTVTTQTITGRATSAQQRTYAYLPFELPLGARRLEVAYRYSDQISSEPWLTDGNTVDLGLIDSKGHDFGAMGFRGWSGSNRDRFFLTEDEATPGYLPGALYPGTWFVHLGFYKIAPQGCQYEVTVTITHGDAPAPASPLAANVDPRPRLQLADQPLHAAPRADGWYRGELHCHTVHSDGDSTVAEVIDAAATLGLDFLAITDHNALSHLSDMLAYQQQHSPLLTLIPGCEMTTYYGHWNAWGLSDWVEFRIESERHMRQALQAAKTRKALVSGNHPRTYGPPWDYRDVTDFHCLEVWNGPWPFNNWEALGYWNSLLMQGRRMVAVGGSDMHQLKGAHREVIKLGSPTTWIYCPDAPTAPNLLGALSAGHSFISESPTGPRLVLRVGQVLMGGMTVNTLMALVQVSVQGAAGSQLILVGRAGVRVTCPIPSEGFERTFMLGCSDELFLYALVQAQVLMAGGHPLVRAITNPIYFG
jgi:hypothetical protein